MRTRLYIWWSMGWLGLLVQIQLSIELSKELSIDLFIELSIEDMEKEPSVKHRNSAENMLKCRYEKLSLQCQYKM